MSKPKKRRSFYFTPELEKQFNLVTVPGTNVNSNVTVGENARKTGVQALNFLAQEAARKDAEIEARSDRKTIKRLTTVGERLRGDNGYSSYMSGGTGMSGRDPLLGTIFDWTVGAKGIDALGKTALWNFAKYGPSNLFRGLARNYFINNAFKLELRKPILLSNRTISVKRSNNEITGQPDLIYTLYNEFGEPIGLTNIGGAVFGSGNKTHRMVDGVMSMRNAHKVSEDTYNAAVQDIIDNGGKGLESGWSLMMPLKTLTVTSKFPHTVIGLEFGNPVRLLTGPSKRPIPQKVLGTHYLEKKPSFEIRYNESTGNFEKIPVTNLEPYVSTSLKFFERPTHLSPLELAGATKLERNFTPRWHVAKYPGYLLKGLMGGSPLERQISKNGTISVNLLNAYFNKASQIEREVANKVLAEKFAGLKTIDYNLFKKAVLDELITYDVNPVQKYRSYGMSRLGFDIPATDLDIQRILLKKYPERFSLVKNDLDVIDRTLGTEYFVDRLLGRGWNRNSLFPFEARREYMSLISNSGELYPEAIVNLFSSPRIPKGNATHYDANTLGHSRLMYTPEDPQTLYILESQSDWALKPLGLTKAEKTAIQNIDKQLKTETPIGFSTLEELQSQKQAILDKASQRTLGNSYLALYLHDNYLQRQLQENLRHAAESGLTKMRYPTSETAAKIEGYTRLSPSWELIEALERKYNRPEGYVDLGTRENFDFESLPEKEALELSRRFKVYEKWDESQYAKDFWKEFNNVGDYAPQYQTILKKYADFPKLFLKLYKGLEVRTVTDAKGNTWYEVDVPKGYLSREWQFKKGGKITINNTEI